MTGSAVAASRSACSRPPPPASWPSPLGVTTIQSASAAPSRREFTATITPAGSTANQTVTPVITLTNSARSNNDLGSAQVVVPAGFTAVQATGSTPAGWEIRYPTCSAGSPTGCGAPGTTLIEVATPSVQGAQKVAPGQSLTLSLSAVAPSTPGAATPSTSRRRTPRPGATGSCSRSPLPRPSSPSPPHPPPSWPSPPSRRPRSPPGSRSARRSRLLDADGQPTTGSAPVTLAGDRRDPRRDHGGDRRQRRGDLLGPVDHHRGVVHAQGDERGPHPRHLDADRGRGRQRQHPVVPEAPQTALTAGQSVTAQVALLDSYGNQTSDTTTVTLTATGPGGTVTGSTAASSGVASVSAGPITAAGTYTVSVSGLSAAPAATSLTVNAGAASQLVFNPAPPSTVQAGQPYAVSVDVLDAVRQRHKQHRPGDGRHRRQPGHSERGQRHGRLQPDRAHRRHRRRLLRHRDQPWSDVAHRGALTVIPGAPAALRSPAPPPRRPLAPPSRSASRPRRLRQPGLGARRRHAADRRRPRAPR